jgi:RND family efflux transporter MFP subunit
VAAAVKVEAETLLAYTRVTAPFDGVVTAKHADVGDLATPGRRLLAMENPASLRLEVDVPEALVGRVQLGDRLPVQVPAAEKSAQGVVSEISPTAAPGSRTFLVKLDLPDDPAFRVGQFGRAEIAIGESAALFVPASAVLQRGQMEMVFVVADGAARLRLVKTGRPVAQDIELLSGVSAGEQVVVGPASDLVDGQPVEVRP